MTGVSSLRLLFILAFTILAAPRTAVVDGFVGAGGSLLVARVNLSNALGRKRITERKEVLGMFFGGSSGAFPKLYDGWFKKTGQIQKDIIAGTKSALR